jgi:hypothetical protein
MDWERPNFNRTPYSKSGSTQGKFITLSREVSILVTPDNYRADKLFGDKQPLGLRSQQRT